VVSTGFYASPLKSGFFKQWFFVGGEVTSAAVFANSLVPFLGDSPRRTGATSGRFRQSPLVCPGDRFGGANSSYQFHGVYTTGSTGFGLSYAQNSNLDGRRASIANPSKVMAYMDFEDHYLANFLLMNRVERLQNLRGRHRGI
jgi:hypothetical protein